MKRWAPIIAGLYCLILAVLTVPVILLAFAPRVKIEQAVETGAAWQYWLWLAVMTISQFSLLSVPVSVANRRPVTRSALWPTLLASGLMAGGLAVGAGFSLLEFFTGGQTISDSIKLLPLALGPLTWCIWALVFAAMSKKIEAFDWVSQQCRLLFKGSVLELLIAVPTHIVARSRDYCCAGLMTFIGLTMGISVMLFSFGPAVMVLYAARWRRLHPSPPDKIVPNV